MIKREKILSSLYKETQGMQRLDYPPLHQDALPKITKGKKKTITISFTLATDNTKMYL